MARRRNLTSDEQALWDRVARTVHALHKAPEIADGAPADRTGPEPAPTPVPDIAPPPARPRRKAAPRVQPSDDIYGDMTDPPRDLQMPTLAGLRIGSRTARKLAGRVDLAPTPAQAMASEPLRMDAGTHKSMTRGRIMPEARLDLHGMTLDEAHPELVRFVLNAHAAGLRLVLVITGKGKDRDDGGPIPTRRGVLRHQLPHWLRLAPLAPVILQVTQAHLRHGGEGAWYVYLRRTR